jgi:Mycobacterium membrane protein
VPIYRRTGFWSLLIIAAAAVVIAVRVESGSSGKPGPVAVTYEITGTGTADIHYYAGATRTVTLDRRSLPWHATVTVPGGFTGYSVTAKSNTLTTGTRLNCTITVAGTAISTDRASGTKSDVLCAGRGYLGP